MPVSADGHVTAVVACCFLESGASSERAAALTADSRGRLLYHNVSAYLSLTAMLAGGFFQYFLLFWLMATRKSGIPASCLSPCPVNTWLQQNMCSPSPQELLVSATCQISMPCAHCIGQYGRPLCYSWNVRKVL